MLTTMLTLTLMLSKLISRPTTHSSGTLPTPTTISSRAMTWVTRKNGDRLSDSMSLLIKTSLTISRAA